MTPEERQKLETVITTLENWEKSDIKSAQRSDEKGDHVWQGFWNGRATAFGMALGLIRQLRDD